ncbi:lytic polysaccharide monooxygenase [Annulohypoxylon truncatum]|uniref:lytic polysaccharide monooxygenase n=1 Tax=Annulohypoxylon truncatum TaxID=327061 RepID=UPI0020085F6D|nr:lytic polysaccharide monooxygenase [Annulohypoxylon truncatum]KAI1205540.1 lytic polysaccharide monooxygenase [Annulohypoxylon truncatum]
MPTVMAIGDEQTTTFSGNAVHGGGSCQLSLAGPVHNGSWADYPLRNSNWKVIHSIEGGCPARNQKGNIDGPNPNKYSFKIPEGIEPGDYIFSWTWLARIGGEPEYYQNCAPVTVTPSKIKRKTKSERRAYLARRTEFPELFMANMGEVSGGCTTEDALREQLAIAFPDPGLSVDHPEGTANLFKQQCDGNPRARKGQGENFEAKPTSTLTEGSSPVFSSTSASVTSASSTTSSSSAKVISTLTSDPVVITTSPFETCIEGHLTCLEDSTHFAICTGGQLTAPQPVPAGFKCRAGSSIGLDTYPA